MTFDSDFMTFTTYIFMKIMTQKNPQNKKIRMCYDNNVTLYFPS